MIHEAKYISLTDFLFNNISKDILQGEYKPGDQLIEQELQDKYQVSKTPLREAFQMLINTGLVERKARKGCFIKKIDIREIRHIYEIRILLEGLAAKEAYERFTEADTHTLQQLYEAMRDDAYQENAVTYYQHHNEFQKFFGKVSGNDMLVEICEKLRMQNIWYKTQFYKIDIKEDFHTHDELVKHFTEHDLEPEDIQKIMQKHIAIGFENFLENFPEKGDDDNERALSNGT